MMKSKHAHKLEAPMLGKREIQTLDFFWRNEESSLSAVDILNLLEQEHSGQAKVISLHTIQSTIERLWRKKLLERKKVGKAYIYSVLYSKQEVIGSLLGEIKEEMGQGDDWVMLTGIMAYLQSWDSDLSKQILKVCNRHIDETQQEAL